ncbi:general transcription factor IIF subunit 1-like [Saccostrea cucullata]|uniref:general transcription factor IIF subunit 1-like n=1 Tax=Saccostrea cuccullata TaxID=36930 RepID=UPI002ED11873
MATTPGQPGSSNVTTQEFVVRVPKGQKKKYKMMKFSTGNDVDFVKLSQTPIRMERENNYKEFKSAYDIDVHPKFGAGSEYGREQKEEARRKKYGIMSKKYNPEEQPWILKIGKNKEMKKMKGVKEGTITENTSYYIFTQCADGAFEAFPVEEWYTFSPIIKYKYLNSEEAEEEFNRRDKTMNLFSVMVRNRVRNEEEEEANPDEEDTIKTKTKSKKKEKSEFKITDEEDWANYSDEGNDEEEDEEKLNEDENDSKSKKKGKKHQKRNAKHNSDDEAVEDSDEGDFDDREVDYITDSSSEEEMEDREKKGTYEEKGVDEERGLRKLIDSEEEESEEEEDQKSNKGEEEEEEDKAKKEKKKEGSESSSSSSSESDSDIEKEDHLASVIFMQKNKKDRASPVPRSSTPSLMDTENKKAQKRKMESEDIPSKKSRTDSPGVSAKTSSAGITEEAIRRYLMRKPMTAKELLKKFKSKKVNMSKEEMTSTLTKYLKKIQPEKNIINKKMYFSLKKD